MEEAVLAKEGKKLVQRDADIDTLLGPDSPRVPASRKLCPSNKGSAVLGTVEGSGHWENACVCAYKHTCTHVIWNRGHRYLLRELFYYHSGGNAGDIRDSGLIPGSGRSPGGGNGNPLQYSYLENPMDRGAWWTRVHGVKKSWTEVT